MAVELTGSSTPSGRSTRLTGSTSKSISRPSSRSSATLPSRWRPKWKSSPTTTAFVANPLTSTSSTKLWADSSARAWSKASTTVASRPVSASSSSRVGRSVRRRGADSGRTTLAGWRSNVTTTLRASSSAASRRTWATTAVWPRWTPSNAPMVITDRSPGHGGWLRSLMTCTDGHATRTAQSGTPRQPGADAAGGRQAPARTTTGVAPSGCASYTASRVPSADSSAHGGGPANAGRRCP